MGNRLSKIYTRTGDDGETGITGGERIAKDHPRMQAIGDVDELNATIGLVRCHELPQMVDEPLEEIQQALFNLGGELSMPGTALVEAELVTQVERWLDAMNEHLPPLKDFVLPGGTSAAAHVHLARTVCRRAERSVVTLMSVDPINVDGLRLLNRLSDYLFVLARALNAEEGLQEVLWKH